MEFFNKRLSKIEINRLAEQIIQSKISKQDIKSILEKKHVASIESVFWTLREVSRKNTSFFRGLEALLVKVWNDYPDNDWISRNFLGIFQDIEIPENLEMQIYKRAFSHLKQVSQAIAIKAFSMSVCFNIAKKYPELLRELQLEIEDIVYLYGQDSGALLSRGKFVLKQIQQRLRKQAIF